VLTLILRLASALCVVLAGSIAHAQSVPTPAPTTPAAANASPLVPTPVHALDSEDLERVVQASEKRISERIAASTPSIWSVLLPALIGVVGALLGAVAGALGAYLTQRSRIDYDLNAAKRQVAHQAQADRMAFRARQLYEFYGPMRARLKQSLELRQELYAQLERHAAGDIAVFYKTDPIASLGRSLWLQVEGQEPRPFRLIDELPLLASRFPNLIPHVGEIVAISDHIAALIHEQIGLVLPSNEALSDMLAKYLAHHSVMREAFVRATTKPELPPLSGYSAVFPRELDRIVEQDFAWLRQELSGWEASVQAWLAEAGVVLSVDKSS
jgi:hypothetical protein